MDPTIKDFEAAIAELDTIVKKLEDGHLARFCHTRLEEAERRIEILNERGQARPAPAGFAEEDGDPTPRR